MLKGRGVRSYPFRGIMERPDGFAIVDSIPEGVRKRTALGDRRGYRRFQKVHCPGV